MAISKPMVIALNCNMHYFLHGRVYAQKFYKELSKQEKMVFISSAPKVPKLGLGMEKGRTYIKPKEEKK